MNRADGYRINTDPIYQVMPHAMPFRYDASNYMDLEIDAEPVQSYVNKCRKKGIKVSHMAVIIAAYLRTAAKYPRLNRFIMNKNIYARNHFCVSFVTLKEGELEEIADVLECDIRDFFERENDKK